MKSSTFVLPGTVARTNLNKTSASNFNRGRQMFCVDDGLFIDILFTFSAFLLVFAIGLGLGLLTRG